MYCANRPNVRMLEALWNNFYKSYGQFQYENIIWS